MLTPAEVTAALKHQAPAPTSFGGYLAGVLNDGKIVKCSWYIPYPDVPQNLNLSVTICQCQTTVAQFDSWVRGQSQLQGVKAIRVSGVGERAYLMGSAFGIYFRQKGIDVAIESPGVPGLTEDLPEATLNKNGKPFYMALAKKVIARLP